MPQTKQWASMGESMALRYKSSEHRHYACKHGDDTPEIAGWRLGQGRPAGTRGTSTEGDNV
jgi:xylulose-5-phosphate/fructose-6-phosphate phosphoketolase